MPCGEVAEMTEARAYARRNPSMAGIGSVTSLWANRAGTAVLVPEIQALIAAGYGFAVSVGAGTTPIVGGGNGTVLDQDQAELLISVPSGSAIIPFSCKVAGELPAVNTDGDVEEILIAVDRTAAMVAFAGGTAETPVNLRTDASRGSLCSVQSANTGNHTNPTLGIELARKQVAVNVVTSGIAQGKIALDYEPKVPPILVGPCQFIVYWGGTAAMSAFCTASWVELPEELNMLWGGS